MHHQLLRKHVVVLVRPFVPFVELQFVLEGRALEPNEFHHLVGMDELPVAEEHVNRLVVEVLGAHQVVGSDRQVSLFVQDDQRKGHSKQVHHSFSACLSNVNDGRVKRVFLRHGRNVLILALVAVPISLSVQGNLHKITIVRHHNFKETCV